MAWCLLPKYAEQFKKELVEGKITPEKLNEMGSEGRHKFFAERFGEENASQLNASFESKLLLKNKQMGYINWAKQGLGMNKAVRRDLVSRIEKLDNVLNPAEEKAFLKDLASKKLGAEVTYEEAQKIHNLSKKIAEHKDFSTDEQRIKYGNAILDLQDYTESLVPHSWKETALGIANLPRSLMSTLDLSAPMRQGWGMMSRKEWLTAFGDMFKYAVSKQSYRNMMADIITRPNYDLMKDGKLRITKLTEKLSDREERFLSPIISKIPFLKGSERAYTGFLNKLRADVFDRMITDAKLAGEDVGKGSQVVKDIASVINDFTGSGNLGRNDKYSGAVPFLNAFFFSPRKIAATVNMVNPLKYATLTPRARKSALRNLLGSVSITATLLSLASLMGGDVETDPRSSDFGKAKFGNTRFDLTGGNANYATLIARLMTNKTKSTKTGKVKEMGKGYKPLTRLELVQKWGRNKLSPTASFVADWMAGSNAVGEKFELGPSIGNRMYPMIIGDVIETYKDDPSLVLPVLGADLFGVGTNTYK